jgi:arylformamidase
MRQIGYKDFAQDEIECQFNPQVSVPQYPQLSAERREKSQRVRAQLKSWLDVPYGATPRQVMDIFPAPSGTAPVLLYVHGGYWRGGSKEDNCNFVDLFTARGATVAVIEYDLCPQVTVTEIVREVRSAVHWSYRHISRYGGDPTKIHIAGHSAGGQLAAMALAYDWPKDNLPREILQGAVITSGVHDLEMVMHVSINQEIRMTPEIAKANSPLLHPPLVPCPILVAVGGDEPSGWRQMSEDYYRFCKERAPQVEYLVVPGANHYTMSQHLADAESPLTRAIFRQMGL